jgi:phage FluMu protein Com
MPQMSDQILLLSLKDKRDIACKSCGEPILGVGLDAKANHTLIIPNKDDGIEVRCPVCNTLNAFTKRECVNKKVSCLKCSKLLAQTYPGMPGDIDPLGKKTVFYKLKITCPNLKCSEVNEFYI